MTRAVADRVIAPSLEKPSCTDLPFPKHVAIIMDGNRRWKKLHQGVSSGHHQGALALPHVIRAAFSFGIETLTLFAFSTENFSRSEEEVAEIFSIFHEQIDLQLPLLLKEKIQLRCIGNLSRLPSSLQKKLTEACEQTSKHADRNLILAINYGGKDEILRAFRKLHQDLLDQKISLDHLSENLISSYLDTSGIGDPDLLIRTGGEMRVSNFLLWQIAYTELYVTDVLWPDFTPLHLGNAIEAYQKRSRRGGK